MKDAHRKQGDGYCGPYLVHDGVLRVSGLDDGRLHEVALLVVAVSSGDDFQVWGRLGAFEPLLYPPKRLQEVTSKRGS